MTTVPLSIRVKPDTRKQLQEEAKATKRSVSQLTSMVLESYFDQKKRRKKALDLAIEEAEKKLDKGVFISQEAVHEWFNSLGTDNVLPRPKPDIFRENKKENIIEVTNVWDERHESVL